LQTDGKAGSGVSVSVSEVFVVKAEQARRPVCRFLS